MIPRNEVADLKTILFPYLMCSAVFKGDMAQLQYCLDQVVFMFFPKDIYKD